MRELFAVALFIFTGWAVVMLLKPWRRLRPKRSAEVDPSIRRRRTILAVVMYCVFVLSSWLVPALVWSNGSFKQYVFLAIPEKIAGLLTEAGMVHDLPDPASPGWSITDPVALAVISVGWFALLWLPLLGAFFVKWYPLRFALVFVGGLAILGYFSLPAVLIFGLFPAQQ
jgi:hypothetical protein